ncbi:MAG: ATP-binding cassette domain-containing protein [Campylobacterota bacterium]|nr:ATP-binding cassette domain-containing protein [Campylobacterota bacterium]
MKIYNNEKSLVNISFNIKDSLALVGQSGSGKSLTLKALLGLTPKNLTYDIDVDSSFELIAGKTVSLVPQNPFTALSPLTKVKNQFFGNMDFVNKLFKSMGLNVALLNSYPSELSGGQLQRIVIAMALENRPKLLLLDEPTTALDPKTTNSILELLLQLQKELMFKMLFVTHDIQSAKKLCNHISVIKDGIIEEFGIIDEIFTNPKTAYTKSLIESSFAHREFRT